MFKIKNKNGQGLLEVMAAIYIFAIGILSIVNLSVFNIQTSHYNNDMLVASNLAREAIDIVRNVRDSNWSSSSTIPWDDSLVFPSVDTGTYVDIGDPNSASSFLVRKDFSDTRKGLVFKVFPVGMSWDNCISPQYTYRSSNGVFVVTSACKLGIIKPIASSDTKIYDYILGGTTNVEETGFYRMIFINEICWSSGDTNETILSGQGYCSGNKIGIQVMARVAWYSNGRMKIINTEEKMYNWK